MKHYIEKIQSVIFPYICCICGLKSDVNIDLCSNCNNSLEIISDYICLVCNNKLESHANNTLCKICLKDNEIPFDNLYAIYKYNGKVKKLISEFKYKKKLYYSKILGKILLMEIMNSWYVNKKECLPQAIIPVPLHKKKLLERGFNQTEAILNTMKKELNITVLKNFCVKNKNTKSQASLEAEYRNVNLKQAFSLKSDKLEFKHVAIFDDVVTTMSTVKEISNLLKLHSSIIKVDIWCICRNI